MTDEKRGATKIKELAGSITAISDDKRVVAAVEEIVQIAEDMDARTGTTDPTVKKGRRG